MAQHRTLFSVLLGQPWWVSALAGLALFGIAQVAYPPVAPFVALPFIVIALYVAYRQVRSVSPSQVEARLQAVRELSWDRFSAVVTEAYTRQGYSVTPVNKPAYDFTLTRNGHVSLLQCRRWKVNQIGIAPLQALAGAIVSADAYNAISICAGDFSPQARTLAGNKPIALVSGRDLAVLVGKLK